MTRMHVSLQSSPHGEKSRENVGRLNMIVPPVARLAIAAAIAVASLPAHAIINGKDVTVTEQRQRGLVSIDGGCSGILISADWVMTAGHCLVAARPSPKLLIGAAWAPGVIYESDAIYQAADVSDTDNPGAEIALIHLSRPVEGIASSYRMRFYEGTAESLVGQTVVKYGQGLSILADANPSTGPATTPGGLGTYRAADLVVDAIKGVELHYRPNASGQIIMPGDSGGPGILWKQGTAYLVGITSTANWDCFKGTERTTVEMDRNCRDSTHQVTASQDVSMPAVKAAVEAVLRSTWNARATSQPVMIHQPETPLMGFALGDVNTGHWAQAARLAGRLCYNRGFSAGHFDGHQKLAPQVPDRTFGVQCSGEGTVWRDATMAEIAASGWGFTDINSVSWAQAGRAAERLCATANANFAGGQFTGHQAGDKVGLFCYRSGARWFDATDQELARTGFAFTRAKFDDNDWAQAARAATEFCRAKGSSGGFMNGHNVPGRAGVVCQS